MDLRQLRYFVAVAEELHFGRAAKRLGMSQPPLSVAIQGLEDELGVRLFDRTRRSVALSPVGAEWLPAVRRVLAEADELAPLAAALARGETGSLTLAFVSTADYGLLPPLLERFTAAAPGVRVTLREATSDVQLAALQAGEIDAGLVIPPAGGALPPELAYRPLIREPLVLAAPAAWVEAGRLVPDAGAISLRAVADAPLLLFPRVSAPALYDLVLGSFARLGLTPRIGQEAIQMQTIVSLVAIGLGVALVPESLRNLQRTGVTYLALAEEPPEVETGLAWQAAKVSPALGRFIAEVEAWQTRDRRRT